MAFVYIVFEEGTDLGHDGICTLLRIVIIRVGDRDRFYSYEDVHEIVGEVWDDKIRYLKLVLYIL